MAGSIESATPRIESATKKQVSAQRKVADATGYVAVKEADLQAARQKADGAANALARAETELARHRNDGTADAERLVKLEAEVDRARTVSTRSTAKATREADTYARSLRKLEDAQNALSREIRPTIDLGSSGGAMGSAGGDAAGGFMDGFTGGIAALGTRAGPIGLALAATAGLGLAAGKVLGDQILAGMDLQQGRAMLQAQLGLSDAEAAQYGKTAGEVYAGNFGESLQDVNGAIAAVSSTFGPADLEGLTGKALTFRDVFGTDVAESTATAQNLIVNELAGNATEAFDLMTASFQRVPAAMRDELPDVLSEYAVNFRELGFSGADAIGMLVDTAPRGQVALDKLGDSIKEFTLRATDLGDTGAQATLTGLGLDGSVVANNLLAGGDTARGQTDQIVAGLLAIPDPAQQAQAALSLFGTPLEDLGKGGIPQFLTTLNQAGASMNGFAGSAQNMVDTVGGTAASQWESAMRTIETGKNSMQESLATAFGPILQDAATFITNHSEEITHAFQWIAGAATELGAGIGFSVGGMIHTFGTLVSAVGDTSGWIIDGFGGMVGAAATVADAFGLDGMAGGLRDAQDTLGGFSQDLHGWGEGLTDFGLSILSGAESLRTFDGSMVGTAGSASNALTQINGVGQSIATLPSGKQIDLTVAMKDQAGRPISLDQFLNFSTGEFANAGDAQRARRGDAVRTAPVDPRFPTPTTWTPPAATSSGGGSSGSSSGGKLPDGRVPNLANLEAAVERIFGVEANADVGRRDSFGEHASGEALDIMVGSNRNLGDEINRWILENADAFGLQYNLWEQASWKPDGTYRPMENRGNATQNHFDHIHARVSPGEAADGNYMPPGASESSWNSSGTTPVSVQDFSTSAANQMQQQIGAQLDADLGLSKGLPGLAENLFKFLANLGAAPVIGALSGVTQAYGTAGPGTGLLGMRQGGQATSSSGYSPSSGLSTASAGGFPGLGTFASPSPNGAPYGTAASGVGLGAPPGPVGIGSGAVNLATGTAGTPIHGIAPGQGVPASEGFGLGGGLIGAAMSAGGGAASLMGPGGAAMGAGAQIGIDLINRSIGYGGQLAGNAVQGLMDTFLPVGSELADPSRGWLGKFVGAAAGVRPAGENTAGELTKNMLTPEQVAVQKGKDAAAAAKQGGDVTQNINVTNNRPTEDGTGRDVAYHTAKVNGGR